MAGDEKDGTWQESGRARGRKSESRDAPITHARELAAEETTAAVMFCSVVHWSAPRKRSTQQARRRTYVSSECVSCRCE